MSLPDLLDRPPRRQLDDEAAGRPPDHEQPPGPGSTWTTERTALLLQRLVTVGVVVAACAFTLWQLQPSLLVSGSTPSGGDMGAHVWQPAYMRDHLLNHFRLTGWAPSWYAGFPSLVFYFPLPNLLIVIVNLVMPYEVAFKLVSVSGMIALPVAAWAFGRLSRMPFPGPACMAAATLPFLFGREFTIYGGNIASTLAGEFAFSISLALGLVFLGLVNRGLETGRYRAWAAVVLAATGLCHLLPTLFVVVGAIVLTLMHGDRRRWLWTMPSLAVGACLAAFWSVPFLLRLPYATSMNYENVTQYSKNLFPPNLTWLLMLAGFGFCFSLLRLVLAWLGLQKFGGLGRVGIFLGIMAGLSALAFRKAPQGRLWNARLLPFWFLCLYLLVGVLVAEVGTLVVEALTDGDLSESRRFAMIPVPVVAILAALIWVAFPLHELPFGHVDAQTGDYVWLGLKSSDSSYIKSWATWNYSGYQSSSKSRKAEYFGLIDTMTKLGKTDGCGRAMWEYESEMDQYGTPLALMLLPYWTHECIASMEGLYFESSATTPYHFLNAAQLSLKPSNPVRGLNYPSTIDVASGVSHLQLLGVKYYMALTPETQAQADADGELRLVATSGPWPVSYSTGGTSNAKQRTWKIYEVNNSDIVSPLVNRPVIMQGVAKGGNGWLRASESWYLDPARRDVIYAASGPADWTRILPTDPNPPRSTLTPVQVSNIKAGDDSVAFDVDTVGVPVLVKVSYFPNWHASGAKGPWRVTPNLMVVIPTSHHVRLHYGYTPVDLAGMLLSLLGVAGVALLARSRPVKYGAPRHLRRRAPLSGSTGEFGGIIPSGWYPDNDMPGAQRWWDGQAWTQEVQVGGVIDTAAEPYDRLGAELGGAFDRWDRLGEPSGAHDAEELDFWLGFPAGLDLARYHVANYRPTSRQRQMTPPPPGPAGAAPEALPDPTGAPAEPTNPPPDAKEPEDGGEAGR